MVLSDRSMELVGHFAVILSTGKRLTDKGCSHSGRRTDWRTTRRSVICTLWTTLWLSWWMSCSPWTAITGFLDHLLHILVRAVRGFDFTTPCGITSVRVRMNRSVHQSAAETTLAILISLETMHHELIAFYCSMATEPIVHAGQSSWDDCPSQTLSISVCLCVCVCASHPVYQGMGETSVMFLFQPMPVDGDPTKRSTEHADIGPYQLHAPAWHGAKPRTQTGSNITGSSFWVSKCVPDPHSVKGPGVAAWSNEDHDDYCLKKLAFYLHDDGSNLSCFTVACKPDLLQDESCLGHKNGMRSTTEHGFSNLDATTSPRWTKSRECGSPQGSSRRGHSQDCARWQQRLWH